MSLKNIFSFLSRGESDILDRVIETLDTSIQASEHLLSEVKFLKAHEYDSVNREYETIAKLEEQGDDQHRKLVRELCTGSFFGGIREDLLNMLELIDNIADAAKGAGKVFDERHMSERVIDYFFKKDVEGFITKTIEAAKTFRTAIEALKKSKEDVLSICEEVEKQEDEADELRFEIIKHLFKNEVNAGALDIIMLKDFLVTADDIADNAEDGSDDLLILVAKGYS